MSGHNSGYAADEHVDSLGREPFNMREQLLPTLPEPVGLGDEAQTREMVHRLMGMVRQTNASITVLTVQVRSLSVGMAALRETVSRTGLAMGIRGEASIAVGLGLTPAEKGKISRESWKYVFSGAIKEVWTQLHELDKVNAYPVSLEVMLDLVEVATGKLSAEAKSSISTACTAFNDDMESIYRTPDMCVHLLCEVPAALATFGMLMTLISTQLYVCLPVEFTDPLGRYKGLSYGADPDRTSQVMIVSREDVPPRTMRVNEPFSCLMNSLKPVNRRKVFSWATAVRSDTDVSAGAALVTAFVSKGGSTTLR